MFSLDRLEEFLAVAKTLNLTSAARKLAVPRATLSRRISELEDELGQPLFLRSIRGLTLTGAGETLFDTAGPAVRSAVQACEGIKQMDGNPRGRLRVSVADTQTAAADLYAQFAADYPEVVLEVSVDPQRVDLQKEGIDVALRFGDVGDDSLIAKKLWSSNKVLVATDAYLKRAPCLHHSDDIIHHRAITSLLRDGMPEQYWPLVDGGRTAVKATFAASDLKLRIDAARRHLGLALFPAASISTHLRSGELRPLLEGSVGSSSPVHLVYAPRRQIPLAMRLFIERAAEYYRRWEPDSELGAEHRSVP